MITKKLIRFLQGTMMLTGKQFRVLSGVYAIMSITSLIAAFTTSFGSIYRDIPVQALGSWKHYFVSLINLVDNHDNILVGLIAALLSLMIIVGIYYYFVKINNVFVKTSKNTVTTPQTPWFLFSSLIIAIALGYLFFFYRSVLVDHIFTGAMFIPVGHGASAWLMFFSLLLYLYTAGKLTYESIKEYGLKTGAKRAIVFSLIIIVVAAAETVFIVALLWIIVGIIVLYFIISLMSGGISETLNSSNNSSASQSACPVCGQIGGHGVGCFQGGAFNQYNGQSAKNSNEYRELKR